MIQDAAAKCRFCGEWLDPTKRPDWAGAADGAAAAAPSAAPAPTSAVAPTPMVVSPPAAAPSRGRDLDPAATTTDGSLHRPRRRETQTWSAPAWMGHDDEAPPEPARRAHAQMGEMGEMGETAQMPSREGTAPAHADRAVPPEIEALLERPAVQSPQSEPPPARPAPAIELLATPAPAPEPVEHTIDDVAERMRRIKASAAAVREAMLRESEALLPEVLRDEDDAAEAAVTMHAGAPPAEPAPQPPPDVAAMLGDDFDDDFDDDDDDDDLDDDLVAPAPVEPTGGRKSAKRKTDDLDDLDDLDGDAMPAGGALAGFDFGDDDFGDEDDDGDFDGDFGDVGAARPIPWKPVAAGAAVVLVLGVAFFWGRIFPSETLEETPAGEEANQGEAEDEEDEKGPPDGQVAQGSVAPGPAPGQGQPVVPEGQTPAAVGVPAAVPVDPAAVPVDSAAVPVDPAAVAANPAAVPADPGLPLGGDAAAALDEARGLYQKGGKKRLGEAKEKLQGILDASPNSADGLLLMAQVQLELGEMEASLATATKCTTVSPQTADCWLSIGVLKQNAKDDPAAIAAFERYLALAPEGAYASQVKKQLSRLQ